MFLEIKLSIVIIKNVTCVFWFSKTYDFVLIICRLIFFLQISNIISFFLHMYIFVKDLIYGGNRVCPHLWCESIESISNYPRPLP